MRRVLLVLLIMSFASGGSAVARDYTLQECIELARQHDPQLLSFRQSIISSRQFARTQIGRFLPNVSVSAGYTRQDVGRTSGVETAIGGGAVVGEAREAFTVKSYSAGYNLSVTLFDGFSNIHDYLSSRAQIRGARYDYQQALSDLQYLVKVKYYLVLKAKRDFDVARDALERSEEYLKVFEEKYELGSAARSEVLKQRVQVGNDRLTLVNAEKNLKVARDELARYIGLQPTDDFGVEEMDLTVEPVGELSQLMATVMMIHPQVLASEFDVKGAAYDVKSSQGAYLPRLNLSYRFGWGKNTLEELMEFDEFDHTGTLSLSLSWTIFDGFSREYSVNRDKLSLDLAKLRELNIKNQVVKDIREAYQGIQLAEQTLVLTAETAEAAQEDMELMQSKYDLGAAALWELLDAQVSLKDAQFERVKAEFDYNLALARLKNAMGE